MYLSFFSLFLKVYKTIALYILSFLGVFLPGLLLGSTKLFGRTHAFSSMRALMLSQALAVTELLPTNGALIGSLSCVKPVVHLEFLRSGITLPTNATEERSILDVGLVMSQQIGINAKPLRTKGASKRSVSRMLHLVQLEGRSRVVSFTTMGAKERLLPGMGALVYLHVTLCDKPLTAVRAGVGFLFDVAFRVLLQLLLFTELNSTVTAHIQHQWIGIDLVRVGRCRLCVHRDVMCL